MNFTGIGTPTWMTQNWNVPSHSDATLAFISLEHCLPFMFGAFFTLEWSLLNWFVRSSKWATYYLYHVVLLETGNSNTRSSPNISLMSIFKNNNIRMTSMKWHTLQPVQSYGLNARDYNPQITCTRVPGVKMKSSHAYNYMLIKWQIDFFRGNKIGLLG
jgi:hypothetical protein